MQSSPLKNDRLIRALLKQAVDKTPVWIMRQAGRYLPEYRKLRAEAGDFMSVCTNPELACEVTLQPLRRFDLDAAILFSDILTIPDAMGLGLYFVTGEGPRFKTPVRDLASIKKLNVPDMGSDLAYVPNAVSTIRKALDGSVPLIGFSGSPWTLACYMVEGGPSKNFSRVKGLRYQDPLAMHALLDVLADACIDYLNAQIEAGAQVLQIFDSWGGVLSPADYQEFSLYYMHKIIAGLHKEYAGQKIPLILFTKNGGHWLDTMIDVDPVSRPDAVGLDWTYSIAQAKKSLAGQVAIQGNLDPCALYGSPENLQTAAKKVLDDFYSVDESATGHVFNLGHGIHPGIDPEQVKLLVDTVHAYSSELHKKTR
ncbi:MAG: uroporphyrinogen decarboxylase [Gammaproteobacteria bacterium]|nr:uroporphyrinogen decarboxylase [Gammaproteobacteria bacterium]NNC97930.1 uroporphyrinogen decarboxylase [Gammaproteobacteria bacterium]NNM14272.1 uroporphyrinogen decarboxylase [Gammaproteobacteria bacterium]